jgi:predicted metal-binding membrane protein
MSSQALEFVLRRDRAVILAALIVITGLAWAYVLWLANDMAMGGMDMTGFRMIPAGMGLMMPASAPWQPIEFLFMFMMWVVMMIGMMTPSAAPWSCSMRALADRRRCRASPLLTAIGSSVAISWLG